MTRIKLTAHGEMVINNFLSELAAKRKEILDAKKDESYDTPLPMMSDIIDDMEWDSATFENKNYFNNWACTENYDLPISLDYGRDYYFWND